MEGLAMADITGDGLPDLLAVKTEGRPKGLELCATRLPGGKLSFTPLTTVFTEVSSDDLACSSFQNGAQRFFENRTSR